MRNLLILLALLLISCSKKENNNFKQISENRDVRENLRFTFFLPKKIIPDKDYQYWQFRHNRSISMEAGDTLLRKLVNEKIKTYKGYGLSGFGGDNAEIYVAVVENGKVNFLEDNKFRDFLGTIDNLEEALLLARSYGYIPNGIRKGNEYRKVGDDFELHLTSFNEWNRMEFVSVIITKEGFINTKSLGFCEKSDCSKI